MRGRKPVPTTLKLIRGNPGKRPLPAEEPSATPIGPPPRGMPAAARHKWNEQVHPDVWGLVLSGSDRDMLRHYCMTWAEMLDAERKVKRDGSYSLSPNGMPMKNPWLVLRDQKREELRRLAAEFGGTPSSRSRVSAVGTKPDEKDPTEEFF